MLSLADDIVLRIIDHLDPLNIIQLRQVCTRFNALTRTHIVWVNAYRNPDLFAPPISVSSISTAALERHVVQSVKLEQNWSSSSPTPVISRTVHSGTDMVNFLHLFYGRYLVVGFSDSFVLYDLEGPERPVFKETHQNFRHFTPYCAQHCDAYCTGSRPYLTISLQRSLDIWELCLGEKPPMRRAAQIDDDGHHLVSDISQNYIHLQDSTTSSLFHVPTQRMYKLDAGLNDPQTWKISTLGGKFMPGRVLVTRYHREQMSLQCFDIPEPGNSQEILTSTHSALFDLQLADIPLIYCSSRQFKVFALYGDYRSLSRVCWNIILEDNGTIAIQPWGPKVQHSYDLDATANGYGKARAVSTSAVSHALSGFTISCDGAGEPVIEIRHLHGLGQFGLPLCTTFDGYKGRLCVSNDHRTVQMFDYVRW